MCINFILIFSYLSYLIINKNILSIHKISSVDEQHEKRDAFRVRTHFTFITAPLYPCRSMLSIEEITDVPIVRDKAALVAFQSGLTCTCPIDPVSLHLLGSITYDQKHSFDLE